MGAIDDYIVVTTNSGNTTYCYDDTLTRTALTALALNTALQTNIGNNLMFSSGTTMRGYRLNQGGN